jgi:ubiquinone biosynthesis protein
METIERMAHAVAPDVDVWLIARRVIARLAADQFGCHGLVAHLAREATHWPRMLPRLPTLIAKRAGAAQKG